MSQEEFNRALYELSRFLRQRRPVVTVIAIVIAGIIAMESMFYTVRADEQGVVLRFGRHVRLTEPGLHSKLPWPIEKVQQVPVALVQTLEFGFATLEAGRVSRFAKPTEDMLDASRMLSGDLNLAQVEWIVQYRIHDAAKYLFKIGGDHGDARSAVESIISDVSETVMRRLVGDVSVDDVLTTGRDQIATAAEHEIQAFLDRFDSGIAIVTVRLQSVSPPDPVKDAFDGVNRARQNKERVVNEARGERNRLIPEARGRRDRTIAEAEGYREKETRSARGRANAYAAKLAEYEKSPQVTRARLYLESMEEVLGQVGDIVVIDDSLRGVLPLLNLDARTPAPLTTKGATR